MLKTEIQSERDPFSRMASSSSQDFVECDACDLKFGLDVFEGWSDGNLCPECGLPLRIPKRLKARVQEIQEKWAVGEFKEEHKVTVTVFWQSDEFSFDVMNKMTINEIKTKIHGLTGIHQTTFDVCVFEIGKLDKDKTLADYGFDGQVSFTIVEEVFQISVKVLSGFTVTLNVRNGDLVQSVEGKMYEALGMDLRHFILEHENNRMFPDQRLYEYNVQKGSVVWMLPYQSLGDEPEGKQC